MRNLVYIICILAVLLSGCTGTSRQPQLVAADSLLQKCPDSSLLQLKRMDVPQSRADRMYYYLLLADAANKCYDTLPSDSILQEVADFYDTHGTPNEQVRAYYLLGCVYRDMGEAPQALDCYHDAVLCADTAAADCDYYTLSRVHSQIAALLGKQLLPRQQLEELHLQYADAMRAKDTLCALNAMEQMTYAYDILRETDSSIIITRNLIKTYQQIGLYQTAAILHGPMANLLISQNRYQEAGKCLDIYKTQSGLFDERGNIKKGKETYYGVEGYYYLGINKYDSANFYFRKELEATTDLNNHEYAYRGLFMLYQMTGQRDSMSKYARLAYKTTDAHFQEKQSDELRHMQALYNYSRNQSIARQKTAEANRNRMMTVVLFFILIFVLITGVFVYLYFKRKKQAQIREQQLKYENIIEKMEAALDDLQKVKRIKDEQVTMLIQEKTTYIEQLQQRLEEYESLNEREAKSLEKKIIMSDIYQHFRYLAKHPREEVTKNDWEALQMMLEEQLSNFQSTVYHYCPNLPMNDYRLCMLVRLYFSPSDIAVLTGMTVANISVKRYRLLDKVFNQKEGSAKDFDQMIRNIR